VHTITKPIKLNANAIVTNKEGKFLLVKLKTGNFAGALCIPGGGVMQGELSHEAARREVWEETGIDVTNPFVPYGFCELMSEAIQQHKIVMLLHTTAEGVPKETEEGSACWMTYEEAEPNLLAFAKEAIRIWRNNEIHFALTNKQVDIRNPNALKS
jgi:8-oxo-dGTP pyrophosphatase MutT (NUDIX family)